MKQLYLGFSIIISIIGCSGGSHGSAFIPPPIKRMTPRPVNTSNVEHIVIIVQENRTVDNLFQGFPGADTQSFGMAGSQQITLQPELLETNWDMRHTHSDFLSDYDNGTNDGYNNSGVVHCPCPSNPSYSYVPGYETALYFQMAEKYGFGDNMFATQQGPSFPGHQYITRGTSTNYNNSPLRASENPTMNAGGCDSPPDSTVQLIDPSGLEGNPIFPCFDVTSIFTLMDAKKLSWKYYYPANEGANNKSGFWKPVDSYKDIWSNKTEFNSNVISPSAQVITDIENGNLAKLTFVIPSPRASDHASETDGSGPSWVASVVNAVGESQFWNNTVVIVTWDDWGGWYDHVTPTIRNSYELGYRVPLIVIGPYVKTGHVSHTQYEYGSILHFIENEFNLGVIGTTDNATGLGDFFKWNQPPSPFTPIEGSLPKIFFTNDPSNWKGNPDKD